MSKIDRLDGKKRNKPSKKLMAALAYLDANPDDQRPVRHVCTDVGVSPATISEARIILRVRDWLSHHPGWLDKPPATIAAEIDAREALVEQAVELVRDPDTTN